jgi:hypothetical protein
MSFLFSCLLSSSLLSFPSSFPFSSPRLSSLLFFPLLSSHSSLPFSSTRLSSTRLSSLRPPDAYVYVHPHQHSIFIKSVCILSTTLYNLLDKIMSLGEGMKVILSNFFFILDNTLCLLSVLIFNSKFDS